jgi:hypothetical protein
MQPSEALSTAAQVSVALAGFAGIIVAFRTGSVHEWEPVDKFRLRLLLTNSVLPLTFSLFAMLLLSIEPPPQWTWRACSALSLALTVPFAVATNKGARGFAQYQRGATRAVFYLFAAFGTVALVLQAINLVILNAFWPFLATIFVHLVAAAFQFVRMILFSYDRSQDT